MVGIAALVEYFEVAATVVIVFVAGRFLGEVVDGHSQDITAGLNGHGHNLFWVVEAIVFVVLDTLVVVVTVVVVTVVVVVAGVVDLVVAVVVHGSGPR